MATANALQRMRLQSGVRPAGGFAEAIIAFSDKLNMREELLIARVTEETYESIVHGSPLTGAPGQPVRTGKLRDSWRVTQESPTSVLISTASPYARVIEHNWRRIGRGTVALIRAVLKHKHLTEKARRIGLLKTRQPRVTKALLNRYRKTLGGQKFRNGGHHSVKLTRTGFRRIVESVRRELVAGDA